MRHVTLPDGETVPAWGEKSVDRLAQRNGYRDRVWETRAGTIELRIPKLRQGSCFPGFLEPRRLAEKALTAVIHRAPAGRAIQPWKGRGQKTATGSSAAGAKKVKVIRALDAHGAGIRASCTVSPTASATRCGSP
jgi:hypothetical protein